MQLVVFELDGNEYGINALSVNGILQAKKFVIQKMPGVVDAVEGIIALRGKINCIFNLGKKFKITKTILQEESKFIMLNMDKVVVGFITDEVTDIVKIEDDEIQETPNVAKEEGVSYIKGIGKIEDRIIIILDAEKIISSDEVGVLNADSIKKAYDM